MIPPPHKLGLSKRKFPEWRHHQPAAIRTIGESRTKFTGIVAPTGFGKSLMILGHALHSKERVCILTSTKALQKQYEDDFGGQVLSIMGQRNYDCEIALATVADAPCQGGYTCELKKGGCLPFDLKRAAVDVPIVLTNYQYWLHSMREKVGLGEFDRVIMDESHNIMSELAHFLSTRITGHEFQDHLTSPPKGNWIEWAGLQNIHLAENLKALKRSKSHDRFKQIAAIRVLKRKIALLAGADKDGWILSPGYHKGEWVWDCIQPGRYASGLLFKRSDRFLLTSASIRPRTFQSLFISPKKVTFKEYPSTFPIERRPVYVLPAIAYSAQSTREELEYLVAMMDQFIERRLDRKGIIHSVSYDRAKMFKSMSRFGNRMMTHERDELPAVAREFKASGKGVILVSPAIVEGHSFPYRDAEFTLIPKIPFLDQTTPIHRARKTHDRMYGILETCIAVRQMSGRAMRADDDQNETLILDSQFVWLHRMYRGFFPLDFNESIQHLKCLPKPLPPLVVPK